jgi:hypothetical protein
VGLVLVLVLGGLGSAKMAVKALPLAEEAAAVAESGGRLRRADGLAGPPTPARTLCARAAAMTLGACAVGATYAIMVVAFAGATWAGSAGDGAKLWLAAWLLGATVAPFMAGVLEVVGDRNVTVAFLFVAYYNSLAGWNLDLAGGGFAFFQYAPLFHAARVGRHLAFDALPDADVRMHAGVMVAWAVFGYAWYAAIGLWGKPWLQRRLVRPGGR